MCYDLIMHTNNTLICRDTSVGALCTDPSFAVPLWVAATTFSYKDTNGFVTSVACVAENMMGSILEHFKSQR